MLFYGGKSMSKFYFIATNYDLPCVNHAKSQEQTIRELVNKGILKESDINITKPSDWECKITCYDTEDIGALQISISNKDFTAEGYPVNRRYIHAVNFSNTCENIKNLMDFLNGYLHKGESLELWSVWLNNSTVKNVSHDTICLTDLTIEALSKWSLRDDYYLTIIN